MKETFKLGSHNSMTGFKGHGIVSKLVTLFSRCQKGSLVDQYKNGCIYFDIRYINDGTNVLVGAHGLWKTKTTIMEALFDLNTAAMENDEKVYVSISKEKGDVTYAEVGMIDFFNENIFPNIIITDLCQKHPVWKCIKTYNVMPYAAVHKFITLDWSTIHTLLPIPILWKKVYKDDVEYDKDNINVVDFVCYE